MLNVSCRVTIDHWWFANIFITIENVLMAKLQLKNKNSQNFLLQKSFQHMKLSYVYINSEK